MANLITENSSFDDDSAASASSWALISLGSFATTGGQLVLTNPESAAATAQDDQVITVEIGKTYKFTADGFIGTSGGWTLILNDGVSNKVSGLHGSDESIDTTFVAGGTNVTITMQTGSVDIGETALFDNLFLEETAAAAVAVVALGGAEPGGRGWTSYGGRSVPTSRRARRGEAAKTRNRSRRNYGPSLDIIITGQESISEIRAKIDMIDRQMVAILKQVEQFEQDNELTQSITKNSQEDLNYLEELRIKAIERLEILGA